jgi:glutathionyl-hydroquinone reductase
MMCATAGAGRLTSYLNLWGYARDLYQHPAFRETTDFAAFGEFAAGPKPSFFNDAPWRINVQPHQADWDQPHNRDALSTA